MTFSIKIKLNKTLAIEDYIFDTNSHSMELPPDTFPYTARPKHFIKKIREGARYDQAVIGYKVLPRAFSIGFWGRCRIQINIWPLFTILIKI